MATRERRVYRGRNFEVWTRDGAWFWTFGEGGAIGAAASKDQAEGEVRSVIDQFVGRGGAVEIRGEAGAGFGTRRRAQPSTPDGYWRGWKNALDNLGRYLATS